MDIKKYDAGQYDVAVIGGGHAGIESALAAARLGCSTIMFTISADWIGNMPCNPSIGGTAKGHLVRELDALGGEMGKAADKNTLQSRMLNLGKGPAVHSLRAQIDRRAYSGYMKHAVELQKGLDVKQCEITDLYMENGVWHCISKLGADFTCKSVVIATGTFLGGRVYVGEVNYPSGPDGNFPATELAASLKKLGLPLRRFKTGTPARVARDSIDFSQLEVQEGDSRVVPFSFSTEVPPENKVVCHISYTNDETKRVILENIDRSPLYAGEIEGVGPRYCPSIEDKIVRFSDKKRHQFFIEPCGENTEEMYLQGLSSSLPEEVQIELYKTIDCLKNLKIIRNAYAIEYDCVDPAAMYATLEMKDFPGLYGAGQFNGSSGYEEAAAQGLVAGINAARKIRGEDPLILDRADGYIGTLIDDLVTRGTKEPYRMMTSRSEYRLLLRQDNADERLVPIGAAVGLNSPARLARTQEKYARVQAEIDRLAGVSVQPTEAVQAFLTAHRSTPLKAGCRLIDLMRRPELSYDDLAALDPGRPALDAAVREQVEIRIQYEGYIARQQKDVEQFRRLEARALPADLDYNAVPSLRLEARQKLNDIRPLNFGQAGRISGVSPADMTALMIYLNTEKGGGEG